MATPFTDIYARAVFRFTDPRIVELYASVDEQILRKYLQSAEADYTDSCKYDLTDISSDGTQYNATLDNRSCEVLAAGLAFYWLSSCVLNQRLFRNGLSTKDYSQFSPGNLLGELSKLREAVGRDYRHAIIDDSFANGDMSKPGEKK